MPTGDTYSADVISTFMGGSYSNTFYFQVTDEAVPNRGMDDVTDIIKNTILPELKKAVVDSLKYDAVVVRRLKPARTDVLISDLDIVGDLPQSALPATCYTLVRYFCFPHYPKSVFHWKFTGIPDDANNRGKITVQAQTRWTDFIETVTQSPYSVAPNTYQLIGSNRDNVALPGEQPRVYKALVDTLIRNLRSRQSRL